MPLWPEDDLYPSDDLYPDGSPPRPGGGFTPADVPHLRWPFRIAARKLAVVEQDSLEDVQQSVHAYLATPRGTRPLNPDFGIEDPTFGPGVDGARLAADIEASEDGRAAVTVTVAGPSGAGTSDVTVNVDLAE